MLKLATPKFLAKTAFIHYGTKRFRRRRFKNPRNATWNKPANRTGLWASPLNSNYGWLQASIDMDIRHYAPDNYFKFKIKRNARVLIVEEPEDLEHLPYFNPFGLQYSFSDSIDFEKVIDSYDAIILTEKGQWNTRLSHPRHLYGWDCECILIMNKNIIKFF